MNPETKFFSGLMELQYGCADLPSMKVLADDIAWANGWPENDTAFWNAEAFMWGRKISKDKRELIKTELQCILKSSNNENNLDLGCGAYSYIPSIGFDLSEKMLQFNENCVEKMVGDIEKKLPFSNLNFSSITAIFVLNYVKNYQNLLKEIQRILINEGIFIVVLGKKINEWQRQKELNSFDSMDWVNIFKDFFEVKSYPKNDLQFYICRKLIK